MASHQEWTQAELDAARRYVKGEKLGPSAKKTLARLERRLASEHEYNRRPDVKKMEAQMYEQIDRDLRDGARTGPSSGTAAGRQASPRPSARPGGAASLSAPSRATTARPAVEPVGGGGLALRRSAFDARGASPQDYQARLRQLGVSTAGWYEEHTNPPPPAPGLGIQIKAQKIAREAAEWNERRTKELDASKIDGRKATQAEVANRLQQLLGPHADRDIVESFRPSGGEPLKPPPEPPPRAKAVDAAARRVRHMLKSGERIDARRLAEDQLAALYKARGLDVPGGTLGPATRAPPRR